MQRETLCVECVEEVEQMQVGGVDGFRKATRRLFYSLGGPTWRSAVGGCRMKSSPPDLA